MIRRTVLAVALALALAPIPAAGATITANFYMGAAVPMGDFADDSLGNAQTGFHFATALDARLTRRLATGAEVSWTVNNTGREGETMDEGGGFYTRADEEQYEIKHFGVRARYFLMPESNFRPFALLGIGAYNMSLHYEYALGGPVPTQEVKQKGKQGSDTNFGWRAGIGFESAVSPAVLLGLAAEYNSVDMNENSFGASTASYWTIRASIGHDFGP